MSATLSTDHVAHLAHLSRISLEADAIATYATQLSAVAAYVERLQQVQGKGKNIHAPANVLAEDVIRESPILTAEQVVASAPRSRNRCFVVRPVLPGQEESA
jgi:aspartyl/glutamyl-tRNA(Asn/Gln) amidotransferase C subunit